MFGFKKTNRKTQPVGLKLESLEMRDVPAVIAAQDSFQVQAGSVLTVAAIPNGVLANDFSNTNPNAILAASITQGAQYTNQATSPALPAGTLTFAPNGGFTLIAPSNYQTSYGPITFKYRAIDTLTGDQSTDTTVTINIVQTTQTQKYYATGAGAGSTPRVRVYEAGTGLLKYDFLAYEENFTGGVRVATGDLTGDGIDDIATSPARGGGPRVKVYDGATGILLEDFFAVDSNFRGGAYVAIGNIDGTTKNPAGVQTTRNDLIVGAGEGGGPRVTVYNGANINTVPVGTGGKSTFSTSVIGDFFAYDINSRAGVQVAAGNTSGITDNNKRDFIVTGPGLGGGPQVRVFDGRKVNGGFGAFPPSEFSFFGFSPNSRSGVSVAVGQFRGDSRADIVVGTGDGTPVVSVFDGRSGALLRSLTVPAADSPTGSIPGTTGGGGSGSSTNFGGTATGGGLVSGTAGRAQERGGARIAVIDRNGDGRSDIVAAIGPGYAPRVRTFDGNSFTELDNFVAYPASFLGGVYVGGNSL
ncbi:hypothetical protein BH11PLA2_BH11PLA2_12380 [soil metagenome]